MVQVCTSKIAQTRAISGAGWPHGWACTTTIWPNVRTCWLVPTSGLETCGLWWAVCGSALDIIVGYRWIYLYIDVYSINKYNLGPPVMSRICQCQLWLVLSYFSHVSWGLVGATSSYPFFSLLPGMQIVWPGSWRQTRERSLRQVENVVFTALIWIIESALLYESVSFWHILTYTDKRCIFSVGSPTVQIPSISGAQVCAGPLSETPSKAPLSQGRDCGRVILAQPWGLHIYPYRFIEIYVKICSYPFIFL